MKRFPLAPTLALAAAVALVACTSQGGRADYAKDGDSGAAAPATVQTVNSPNAPDSTAGVGQRSGKPGMAGDTNTARNTGTIQGNQNTQSVPGAATGAAPKAP
jgi:hypothetical protein